MSKNDAINLKGNDVVLTDHMIDLYGSQYGIDLLAMKGNHYYHTALLYPGQIVNDKVLVYVDDKGVSHFEDSNKVKVEFDVNSRESTVTKEDGTTDVYYNWFNAWAVRGCKERVDFWDTAYHYLRPVMQGLAFFGLGGIVLNGAANAANEMAHGHPIVKEKAIYHTDAFDSVGQLNLTGHGSISGSNITLNQPDTTVHGGLDLSGVSYQVQDGRVVVHAREISVTPYFDQSGNPMGEVTTYTSHDGNSTFTLTGRVVGGALVDLQIDGQPISGHIDAKDVQIEAQGMIRTTGNIHSVDYVTDADAALKDVGVPAGSAALLIPGLYSANKTRIKNKNDREAAEAIFESFRTFLPKVSGGLKQVPAYYLQTKYGIDDEYLNEAPAELMDLVRNFDSKKNFEKINKIVEKDLVKIKENVKDYMKRKDNVKIPEDLRAVSDDYVKRAPKYLAFVTLLKNKKGAMESAKDRMDVDAINDIVTEIETFYQANLEH
ncbi:MAG: hypothetical protein PHU12_03595 [Candidatus Aenigmarchaeota archaeon]|nr:hypothetical protein [Candidatus Aenigmarchaeota archaeon]